MIGHIGFLFTTIVAMIGAHRNYYALEQKQGVTPSELTQADTILWGAYAAVAVAAINFLWQCVHDPDKAKDRKAAGRQRVKNQLIMLRDRIESEDGNFDRLEKRKFPFNVHQEVDSFDLLEEDLHKATDLPTYWWLKKKLRNEIARIRQMPRGEKDVSKFMPLFKKLTKKVENDLKGFPDVKSK